MGSIYNCIKKENDNTILKENDKDKYKNKYMKENFSIGDHNISHDSAKKK